MRKNLWVILTEEGWKALDELGQQRRVYRDGRRLFYKLGELFADLFLLLYLGFTINRLRVGPTFCKVP